MLYSGALKDYSKEDLLKLNICKDCQVKGEFLPGLAGTFTYDLESFCKQCKKELLRYECGDEY